MTMPDEALIRELVNDCRVRAERSVAGGDMRKSWTAKAEALERLKAEEETLRARVTELEKPSRLAACVVILLRSIASIGKRAWAILR